jgi:hypothetical protein
MPIFHDDGDLLIREGTLRALAGDVASTPGAVGRRAAQFLKPYVSIPERCREAEAEIADAKKFVRSEGGSYSAPEGVASLLASFAHSGQAFLKVLDDAEYARMVSMIRKRDYPSTEFFRDAKFLLRVPARLSGARSQKDLLAVLDLYLRRMDEVRRETLSIIRDPEAVKSLTAMQRVRSVSLATEVARGGVKLADAVRRLVRLQS